MKIEKLRNNHKKEIIIGTILIVVIGGALTFRLTHSKYRVTQSIDLGSGVINYKALDFKIMAMYQQKDGSTCTDDSCYNEITDRMPSSGYIINTSKSYCTLDNVNHDNDAKVYTYEGKHVFENLKKSDKCYLYFDKYTAGDYILANIKVNTTTPNFSQVAIDNEGIFKAEDGMYGSTSTNKKYTYYWRGKVENNYVKFAGFCWRIIRINGDKTIRMVYDGSTCHANGTSTTEGIAVTNQKYNSSSNQSNYVGWTYTGTSQRTLSGTSSNAKSQIESWYSSNITGTNATKVADGKYCNDRYVEAPPSSFEWGIDYTTTWGAAGTRFAYAGPKRLYESYSPTFNCSSGDVYTLKVGIITADEVAFAGGKYYASDGSNNNTSYYLYNGNHYWTMSPSYWSGGDAYVFYVNSNGFFDASSVHGTNGLRPVINLKSDVTFSSGDGTQNSPYVVS